MNRIKEVFVVEDDTLYGSMLEYHLSLNPDINVTVFSNAKDLFNNLHSSPTAITLDYSLPDLNGIDALRKIQEFNSDIPVIIVSGQEDIQTAVNLLKEGAYDYIVKNDNAKTRIWNSIQKIIEKESLKDEIVELRKEVDKKYDFNNSFIGDSPVMKEVYHLVEKAINSTISISIFGDTGTGKELVAKSIHFNSSRAKKKFVAVNLGAVPDNLIESELFGHEKGAFTGAINQRKGKFEEASGGTIFLDEIGEMSLEMQVKLLRVLQEQEVTRVGANEVISVDARVIIATHKNLAKEVEEGRFREDLYYRVLGLPITLPPLRDRENDIILLAKYFIKQYEKGANFILKPEAAKKLLNYKFPGNVRELKAIIELACVMCSDNQIEEKDIIFNSIKSEDSFLLENLTLKEYNNKIITYYLKANNNNIIEAAKKLNIGKSTIYNLIKSKEISI